MKKKRKYILLYLLSIYRNIYKNLHYTYKIEAKVLKTEDLTKSEGKKKSIYRNIFLRVNDAFISLFNKEKIKLSCNNCARKNCKMPQDLTEKLPQECIFRFWQEHCLDKLENDISKSIYEKIQEINGLKEKYKCNKCAACCRLASSEFSYSELLQKAQNGDIFAKQFTSIFIPYENKAEARPFYPEFFDLLEKKYQNDEKIYFYHCPKLGDDNLCTDYENRPDICKVFPNNPLVIFPKNCGYKKWQDEVEVLALTLHAMVEITEFYKTKIEEALKD